MDLFNLFDVVFQENRARKIYMPRRVQDDYCYKAMYRFRRENVEYLAQRFLPVVDDFRGGALSHVQQMETFLRYIGDPGFQVIFLLFLLRICALF